jgi:hypothetical protein
VLNGRFVQEDVSLSCAEERYLASSNASSSLVWSCRPCATGTYFLGRGEMVEDVEKGNKCTRCPEKGVECVDGKTPIVRLRQDFILCLIARDHHLTITECAQLLVWKEQFTTAHLSQLSQRLLQRDSSSVEQLMHRSSQWRAVWRLCRRIHTWLSHICLPACRSLQTRVDRTALYHPFRLRDSAAVPTDRRWVNVEVDVILCTDGPTLT